MDIALIPNVERKNPRSVVFEEPKKEPSLKTRMGLTNLWAQRMLEEKRDLFFKLTFVGPSAAGKTSIVRQYVHNYFEYEHMITLGMQNYVKTVEKKERHIKMTIWDTPNYSKLQRVVDNACEDSDAIVFVWDQLDREMIHETEEIISEVAEKLKNKDKILLALLNSKPTKYKIAKAQLSQELLDKYSIKSFKVNAMVRDRVRAVFDQILDLLLERNEKMFILRLEKMCEEKENDVEQVDEDDDIEEDKEKEGQDNIEEVNPDEDEDEGEGEGEGEGEQLNDKLQDVGPIELFEEKIISKKRPPLVANPVPHSDVVKENVGVLMETNHYIGGNKWKKAKETAIGCCSTTTSSCKIF